MAGDELGDPAVPTKPWWQSKSILAGIAGTIITALQSRGYIISAEEARDWSEAVATVVPPLITIGCFITGIWGRWRARKVISGSPADPARIEKKTRIADQRRLLQERGLLKRNTRK